MSNIWSIFVLVSKHNEKCWYQMNTNFHKINADCQKQATEMAVSEWTYRREDTGDVLIKTEPINSFGIDVDSSGKGMLISKLGKLKSTIDISDGGEYHMDRSYSQVWIKTKKSEVELEEWLYTTKFPRYFDIVGVFNKDW